MPYTTEHKTKERDGKPTVSFSYECWKDQNTGEGIISVRGNTNEDHAYLLNNRADVADGIKQAENLNEMHYFENQDNGWHMEILFNESEEGIVMSVKEAVNSVTSMELSRRGEKLLNQEHENNINLSLQKFSEQPEINRAKSYNPER